jgi:hypothetical protein
MTILLTTLISALTSIVIVFMTQAISARSEAKKTESIERKEINSKFLNPLRLYLVENHIRLSELLYRLEHNNGRIAELLRVEDPADLSIQDDAWYNGSGTYLASSAYLTACLFAWAKAVRDNVPYLRLVKNEDTRLIYLLLRVAVAFRRDSGIYYVTQPSIGQDMLVDNGSRVRSYREFCGLLRDPITRVWMDRLINYYLETGRGQKTDRIHDAIGAIEELSAFLDSVVRCWMSLSLTSATATGPLTCGPPSKS